MLKKFVVLAGLMGCGGSAPTERETPVASIVVAPPAAQVPLGADGQFSARTYAADGSELFGRSVQWSVGDPSVASVNSGGRVQGEGLGVSVVTARSGSASGSATLSVVTNEPAGFTKLLELPFSDPTWDTPRSQGWDMLWPPKTYQNCGVGDGTGDAVCIDPETVADPAFPNSPVGQHTLPEGFADPVAWPGSPGRSGGTRISHREGRVKEIYASFRVRFDPTITFEGGGGFKILGITAQIPTGGSGIALWVSAFGASPALGLEANQKRFHPGANGNLTSTPVVTRRPGTLPADEVLFVEAYARMNSAANVPDGILEVRVDGALLVDRSDVVWFEETSLSPQLFSGVMWDPIPNIRSPAPENWIRMDDIYASGR